MINEYYTVKEMQEIAKLGRTPGYGRIGARLAKYYEKMIRRQHSEIAQFNGLRRTLKRVSLPERERIAANTEAITAAHIEAIADLAAELVEEARQTGSR